MSFSLSLLWATISTAGWLLASANGAVARTKDGSKGADAESAEPTASELVHGIMGNTLTLGRMVVRAGIACAAEVWERAARIWAEAQANPSKRELRAQRTAPRVVPGMVTTHEWTVPDLGKRPNDNIDSNVEAASLSAGTAASTANEISNSGKED